MPKVSIFMVSFNQKDFIDQAIISALDQSFSDFELFVYDNNSTDGTADRILKFGDNRIKPILAKNNIGPAAARLQCLERSRGKYIAVLDADDIFMPDKLEKQVKYLENNPETGAVFSLAEIIDDNGGPFADKGHFYSRIFLQENRTRHQWLKRFFYECNCLCHSSAFMRKKDYLGLPEPRFSQLSDFNCWVKLCFKRDIHIIQEPLVKYRVCANEANLSGKRPETMTRTRFEFIKILNNYLGISTKDELMKIFPEASDIIDEKYLSDQDLIKYAIAQIALKAGKDEHRVFAVNTLYDLLGQRKIAEKLEEFAGFAYCDFKKLTGVPETGDRDAHIKDLEGIIKGQDDCISRLRSSIKKMESSLSYKAGKSLTFPLYVIREYLDRILIIIKGSSLFNRNRISKFPEEFGFRGYLDGPDDNARCKITRGWFISKKPFNNVELFIGDKKIAELERTIVRKDVNEEIEGYDHIDKKGFEYILSDAVLLELRNKKRTLFIRFHIDGERYIDKFRTLVRL